MPSRTQKAFDANVKALNTKKQTRKVRCDKLPEYTNVKSEQKFIHGHSFPWYLHPVKKDAFNKSWFHDYEDACKQIKRLHLKPEQYTLWHLVKSPKKTSTKQKA